MNMIEVEMADAAGEGARDEPLGAGAFPKRIERKPPSKRAPASDEGKPLATKKQNRPPAASVEQPHQALLVDRRLESSEQGQDEPEMNLAAELAAARSAYAARIAAAQLTLPKADRAAGVRALRDELRAATREITERRRASSARRKAKRLQRQTTAPRKLEK